MRKVTRAHVIEQWQSANPMTNEEIENKFRANAAFLLSDNETRRIIEMARKVESLTKITDLVKLTIKA